MGFPVLRLTSVAFDNVYQFLDVPEVILLSKCSKTIKAIVKSKEVPSKKYHLDVPINSYETCVELQQHDHSSFKTLFSWSLYKNNRPVWDADKVISDDGARIGAVELTMREADDKWRSTVKEEHYEKKILAIVKLFKDLFGCTIREVILDSDAGDSFRKLFMESDVLHRAIEMDLCHYTCTHEEMSFMLDHFTVNCFSLDADCGPGFSYSKPLKQFPRLELQYSRWINLSHLLELAETATSLDLGNTDMITDKDLNELVKWWMESNTKDLKVVSINRRHDNRDRAAIMEGIPSTPARKKKDYEIPLFAEIWDENYNTGLDICRKDGVEATVMVEGSSFVLGVLQKQDRGNN